jgi:hypothetical protein
MNKLSFGVGVTFLPMGLVISTVLPLLLQSVYGQRILEGDPTEYPKCLSFNVTSFCEYIIFANQTVVENPHTDTTTGVPDELDEKEKTYEEEFDKAVYDREQEGLEDGENPDWAGGHPHCEDPGVESSEGCWELDD